MSLGREAPTRDTLEFPWSGLRAEVLPLGPDHSLMRTMFSPDSEMKLGPTRAAFE